MIYKENDCKCLNKTDLVEKKMRGEGVILENILAHILSISQNILKVISLI